MDALSRRFTAPLTCGVALLSLPGCDPRRTDTDPAIDVQTVKVLHIPAPPIPTRSPPMPSAPVATPTPRSLAEMRPHKTFTDPPLPPELLDDGGLRPLPPRPPR